MQVVRINCPLPVSACLCLPACPPACPADAGSESSAQGFSPGDTASGSATSQTAAGEGAVDSSAKRRFGSTCHALPVMQPPPCYACHAPAARPAMHCSCAWHQHPLAALHAHPVQFLVQIVQAAGLAESHADTFGVGEVAGEGGTLVNGLTQAQGDAQGDPAGTGTGGGYAFRPLPMRIMHDAPIAQSSSVAVQLLIGSPALSPAVAAVQAQPSPCCTAL